MNTDMRKMAGCRESFEALVQRYQRRLYLYALQILHSHEDAEEAVQDAFMRAYRALGKDGASPFDGTRLGAWLFKITLNVARNRLRRKKHPQISFDALNATDSWHSALEDRSSPDVILDRNTTFTLVERSIRELPTHMLETAHLWFIEGLTHGEIAQHCSKPEGTVKSHVFRAKRKLRKALAPSLAA